MHQRQGELPIDRGLGETADEVSDVVRSHAVTSSPPSSAARHSRAALEEHHHLLAGTKQLLGAASGLMVPLFAIGVWALHPRSWRWAASGDIHPETGPNDRAIAN